MDGRRKPLLWKVGKDSWWFKCVVADDNRWRPPDSGNPSETDASLVQTGKNRMATPVMQVAAGALRRLPRVSKRAACPAGRRMRFSSGRSPCSRQDAARWSGALRPSPLPRYVYGIKRRGQGGNVPRSEELADLIMKFSEANFSDRTISLLSIPVLYFVYFMAFAASALFFGLCISATFRTVSM